MSGQAKGHFPAFRPDRLNDEIDRRFWTVDQTARELGVPEKTLRRWRKGEVEPQRRNVQRIAEVFERDPHWFYGDDEQRKAA